jgi:dienelactone hydrolase
MLRAIGLALVLACAAPLARAQEPDFVTPLWAHGAPGSEAHRNEPEEARDWWVRNVHNPSLTAFLPSAEKATGAAIVIIPGGGHREIVWPPEGLAPARYLQGLGVAAFALKYRLGAAPGSPYDVERDAGADARRAMRLVRAHAAEWGVDPHRIGVMGWSAGGELAALLAYGDTEGEAHARDPIDRQSAAPDFQIVIYPGGRFIPDHLTRKPPPAFFLAAWDDAGAADNIRTLLALYREAGGTAEAHLFAQGSHAFNMGDRSELVTIHSWPQRMADWLADSGLLAKTPPPPPSH